MRARVDEREKRGALSRSSVCASPATAISAESEFSGRGYGARRGGSSPTPARGYIARRVHSLPGFYASAPHYGSL